MPNISNKKNLKQKISIRLKNNTPLKLKYNSYKLKVKFGLKLKYTPSTIGTKIVYREVIFNLSRNNNYSLSKVIDFGDIDQGGRSTIMGFQMDKKLINANIDTEILSTEVKSHYEK